MKNDRQNKIIEIISKNNVDTQELLLDLLKKEGYDVTQATVSRDIKELNIVKISVKDLGYKYAIKDTDDQKPGAKYTNILRESLISVTPSNSLIIVKTYSGMANAAAAAIDFLWHHSILGSIAGDDTIFVATSDKGVSDEISAKIRDIASGRG